MPTFIEHHTKQAILDAYNKAKPLLIKAGVDLKTDEFKIIQPFNDHEAIIIEMEERDGERELKMVAMVNTVVLPVIEGVLDVFEHDRTREVRDDDLTRITFTGEFKQMSSSDKKETIHGN